MKAMSLGLAKIVIDGTDLGSVTSASVDLQLDTLPMHDEKVGSAYIVGSRQVIKSCGGSLSVATEEVGSISNIIAGMLSVLKGEQPVKKNFTCSFNGSGGSMSGQVLLIPQFTANISPESWSSINIQPVICGQLVGTAGTVVTNKIANVPFLDMSKVGALTVNKNSLCCAAQCNSIGIAELNLSVSCQYTPIYRNNNPWPVDYVVDTAKVSADIGFYDFAELSSVFETESPVDITFLTIGGSNVVLNLGEKCVKVLSGMKSTNGINTWHVKVEGSGF
jgi:hypothetical protein